MKLKIKNKYGITPDNLLNHKEITLKAKGLFGYLQSKPDGWKFSVGRIALQNKDNRASIDSAIKELENNGYLIRKPKRNKNGKWDGYDYVLYEKSTTKDNSPLAEKPLAEKPLTDKPIAENSTTLSKTDYSNTDISNTEKGAKQSFAGKETNNLIELFKEVNPSYKRLYPNKTQRSAIERMLKQHGNEKLEWIIKVLPETNKREYAPTITTPLQLETKIGNLIAFIQKEKVKQNKNKISTIQ